MYKLNDKSSAYAYATENSCHSIYSIFNSHPDQNVPLILMNAMGRCYAPNADLGRVSLDNLAELGLAIQTFALFPEKVHDFVDRFLE